MAFLNPTDLIDAYTDSKRYCDGYRANFSEFKRLRENKPRQIEGYDDVTDGTLSALVADTPMRIWGQQQTGRVVNLDPVSHKYTAWQIEIINAIFTNRVIPNANTQAPYFLKYLIALDKALTYGCSGLFSFNVARPGYTGADFVVVDPRHIHFEAGKVSDRDSDYIFMDTYYTKLQIKRLLKDAKKQAQSGQQGNWNPEALAAVLKSDAFHSKEGEDNTADGWGGVVKMTTCFQRGFGSPYYTFAPEVAATLKTPVRTWKNINRTGDLPLTMQYHYIDLSNPFGVSQMQIAGPTQNALDYFTAAHIKATQQGIEPPISVRGDTSQTNFDSLVYAPNALWEEGNAEITVRSTTNSVYTQFPENYGLYKTQVMNLQGTSDATVSAQSGNPQYSKTPAGIKYQQERTNAKDNYLRQRIDETYAANTRNLINLTLANMSGEDFISVDEMQRERLERAGLKVPDPDKVLVEYDKLKKGQVDFIVDANSSIVKNDDDTKTMLIDLTRELSAIPNLDERLAAENKQLKIGELVKQILLKAGTENVERILVEAPNAAVGTPDGDTTVTEEQVDSGDAATVALLRQKGWSDDEIAEYLQAETNAGGGAA